MKRAPRIFGRHTVLTAAATVVLVMFAGHIPAQALPTAAPATARPAPPQVPAVTGIRDVDTAFAPAQRPANHQPTAITWPAATDQVVAVATGRSTSHAHVASAVAVGRVDGKDGLGGPRTARVQILGRDHARALGVQGVVFAVSAADAGSGQVKATLDYSTFAEAVGGNYGSRLRLVRLPECALTTPQEAACRQPTPLGSVNDATARTVTATITVTAQEFTPSTGSASHTRLAAQPVVLAAQADPGSQGGDGGTYAATDLSPSGSWTAGGSTGSFTYGYPIVTPPATTTVSPQLGLIYDSSSVDGQTASTQAQGGWAGNGWNTARSFIEQSFTSCEDDPQGVASPVKTPDLCYNGPILTLSLNGSSAALVWDQAQSAWKPQQDNGERIAYITNSGNGSGTYDTGYWTVTTRDGTIYSFGRNQLPGWTGGQGQTRTNSVDTVPVYSPHSGGPCYQPTGFTNSVCTMASRWNLDYVTDVHGGAMALYYKQYTNFYGRNKGASDVAYIRDSHIDHVDYGFTDGNAYNLVPNKILFGTGARCVTEPCLPLNDTTKANWLDVPYDLICNEATDCPAWGPSFFSTVRLTSITTQQWSTATAQHTNVDGYSLDYTMPGTGDGTAPTLFLTSITRTGYAGAGEPITLPAVQFGPVSLPNRVDPARPLLRKHRIQTITTESGSVITVYYGTPDTCAAPVTLDPATNTKSCYPVRWTPPGYTDPITDWFHRYAVTKVTASDPTGQAAPLTSVYRYLGGAAWHYDDNELVEAKYRSYGQYRGYGKVQTLSGDGVNDRQTLAETLYYRGMSKNNSTAVVNVTDSLGGEHEDHDQLAGRELEATSYLGDGGPADHSNITHYWVSASSATRSRIGLPDLTATTTGTAQTLNRKAITTTGVTTWRQLQTDNTYETSTSSPNFGLLLRSYNHTVPADAAYDFCTSMVYAPANTSRNITGLISETETVSVKCGGFTQGSPVSVPAALNTLTAPTATRPAQVVSAERTFYDDPTWNTTFPQATPPDKGLATMTRKASGYSGGTYTWHTTGRSTYDGYGRLVDSYNGNSAKTTTTYSINTAGLTVGSSVTNPLSQTSSGTSDPRRGTVATRTDANGVVTRTQYDTLGRLTKIWTHSRPDTSAANVIHTYHLANNAVSYVKTESLNEALGYITSIALYDALLRPRQTQAITPQSGRLVTDTFYDSHGWIKATYNNWWDPANLPDGGAIVEAANLGVQVASQDVYTYDGLGRTVKADKAKYGSVVSTTVTVDNGDRTTVVPPDGAAVTTTVTDPIGRVIERDEYTTNPTLNPPADTFTGIYTLTGGTKVASTYGFDGHGSQNTVTNKNGTTWTTVYNLLGQAESSTDPDAGTTTGIKYDGNGNLIESTNSRSKTVSYTYDVLGRKTGMYASAVATQIVYGQPGANQLGKWVYDNSDNAIAGMTYPLGKLTSSTAYWGTAAYTKQYRNFDVFGNSLGETITIPASAEGSILGQGFTINHTYGPNTGVLLQNKYPLKWGLPAETVNHTYGGTLYLPKTVGGLGGYAAGTTFDAYGRVNQSIIGSGASTADLTYTYDEHTGLLKNRLVTRSTLTPDDVDEQAYERNKAGNITKLVSTRLGSASTSETQCYRYDTISRLRAAWTATDNCAATPDSGSRSMVGSSLGASSRFWTTWDINDIGNREQQTQWGTTTAGDTATSYTYNGNGTGQPHILTSTTSTGAAPGSTTYTYDSAGNMKTRTAGQGNQILNWDHAGRLTSITGNTSGPASYIYDADGNLLLEKNPGHTILYLPGQQVTLNTATNTTSSVRYYPLPGGATAIRTGSGTNYKFSIPDHHGTGELLLDYTAQNPSWRQHTPYGVPRGATIAWPDNRGFLNQPTSTTTGLTNLGARNYDPTTGRFISIDPEFEPRVPQSLNGYLYANNNPITHSDPTGRDWWNPATWNLGLNDSELDFSASGGEWSMLTHNYAHGIRDPQHDALLALSLLPFGLDHVAMHADAELYRAEGDFETAQAIEDAIGADISMGAAGPLVPGAVFSAAALINRKIVLKPANVLRNSPGIASGRTKGITADANWLKGSHGNAGHVPKQVADRLRGRTFNNFDEFREAFWKEVGNDPTLSSGFSPDNIAKMKNGNAPFAVTSQQVNGQQTYQLHHVTPIHQGGGVYDMDNLVVVTPLYHQNILDRRYHYGNANGERNGGI